jgi:hypothetical protein
MYNAQKDTFTLILFNSSILTFLTKKTFCYYMNHLNLITTT